MPNTYNNYNPGYNQRQQQQTQYPVQYNQQPQQQMPQYPPRQQQQPQRYNNYQNGYGGRGGYNYAGIEPFNMESSPLTERIQDKIINLKQDRKAKERNKNGQY